MLLTACGGSSEVQISDQVELEARSENAKLFFVAGHAYGMPGKDEVGFHPPFESFIDRFSERYEFGVFTGDFIIQPTEKNWEEVNAVQQKWNIPLHYVAGNHDAGDRMLFRKHAGDENRAWTEGENHFVVWDLNSNGWDVDSLQWELIEQGVSNDSTVKRVFVFAHQLFFVTPNAFERAHYNSDDGRHDPQFFKKYYEKLTNLPVEVYFFCGDVGAFSHNSHPVGYRIKNAFFLCSGMGSGTRDHYIEVALENGKDPLFWEIRVPSGETTQLDSNFFEGE